MAVVHLTAGSIARGPGLSRALPLVPPAPDPLPVQGLLPLGSGTDALEMLDMGTEGRRHLIGVAQAVHRCKTSAGAIERRNRLGKRRVGRQAAPDRPWLIVFSTYQAAPAVGAGVGLRLAVFRNRLGNPAGSADPPAAEPPHDGLVGDRDKQDDQGV